MARDQRAAALAQDWLRRIVVRTAMPGRQTTCDEGMVRVCVHEVAALVRAVRRADAALATQYADGIGAEGGRAMEAHAARTVADMIRAQDAPRARTRRPDRQSASTPPRPDTSDRERSTRGRARGGRGRG